MDKTDKRIILKDFQALLKTFSLENNASQTPQTFQKMMVDLVNKLNPDGDIDNEQYIIRRLKFFTHPEKIDNYPSINAYQEQFYPSVGRLFDNIDSAKIALELARNTKKRDWASLLKAFEERKKHETSKSARDVLTALINLIQLKMQYDQNIKQNYGERYQQILTCLPAVSSLLTVVLTPYITALLIIGNTVREAIYNDEDTQPWHEKSILEVFFSLTNILSISVKQTGITLCYYHYMIADWLAESLYLTYECVSEPAELSQCRDMIIRSDYRAANTNVRALFDTEIFQAIADLAGHYIKKQESCYFANFWQGSVKAKIMRDYLITLSNIERSETSTAQKHKDALTLTDWLLLKNPAIYASGYQAMAVVIKIKALLETQIEPVPEVNRLR